MLPLNGLLKCATFTGDGYSERPARCQSQFRVFPCDAGFLGDFSSWVSALAVMNPQISVLSYQFAL